MSGNTEIQGSRRSLELVKWLIVAILLIVAIVGNYYYRNYHFLLRALAIILIVVIAGGVSMMTSKGRSAVALVREARAELRKVIWPTSQEALYTTLIVAAVTAMISLILWGLDSLLIFIVSFITSLRFY